MADLFRMDLYRMRKARAFIICLILAFVMALADAPLGKLMITLAKMIAPESTETFVLNTSLSQIIANPFPMMNLMIILLSLCSFFYADQENGYVKNIAGQVPMKGLTILSKFLAALVHNLIFIAVGIIGNLIGSLIVMKVTMDSASLLTSLRDLGLKLLLLQSMAAILLLVVSSLRLKSVGYILAVLFGLGMTSLVYTGINEGLGHLLNTTVNIIPYMPDSAMSMVSVDPLRSLLVAVAWGAVFLILAIRIFDRRDVK